VPTVHKAELDHVGFKWHEDSNRFHEALLNQAVAICNAAGLRRESNEPSQHTGEGLNEQENELTGAPVRFHELPRFKSMQDTKQLTGSSQRSKKSRKILR